MGLGECLGEGKKTGSQRFKDPLERSKDADVCCKQGLLAHTGALPAAICCLMSWELHSVPTPGKRRAVGPGLGSGGPRTAATRIRSQQLEARVGSLFRVKKH